MYYVLIFVYDRVACMKHLLCSASLPAPAQGAPCGEVLCHEKQVPVQISMGFQCARLRRTAGPSGTRSLGECRFVRSGASKGSGTGFADKTPCSTGFVLPRPAHNLGVRVGVVEIDTQVSQGTLGNRENPRFFIKFD